MCSVDFVVFLRFRHITGIVNATRSAQIGAFTLNVTIAENSFTQAVIIHTVSQKVRH